MSHLVRGDVVTNIDRTELTPERLPDSYGFKAAGHLRHKGAIPSPPTGIVVKQPKTA